MIGPGQKALGLLFLSVALTACQGEVAARVNGRPIYAGDVDKQVTVIQRQPAKDFKYKLNKASVARIRGQVLENLVVTELVLEAAEKAGVKVGEGELDKETKSVKAGFPSDEGFKKFLRERGLTESLLRDSLKRRRLSEKMRERVLSRIKVTDREITTYLEKNVGLFDDPPKWKLRRFAAKKGGGELVNDPSPSGNLGWLTEREMGPVVYAAVKSLLAGETSSEVDVGGNRYIYVVEETKPTQTPPLDEIKPKAYSKLLLEKEHRAWSSWLAGLRKKAEIEITGL